MFNDFESRHQIEGARRKRHRARRALKKSRGWKMTFGIVDRFRGKIDTRSGRGYAREISGAVAGSATQVQYAEPLRKARCQCIASDVFPPKIVIDLARYNALSSEFAHGVTAP